MFRKIFFELTKNEIINMIRNLECGGVNQLRITANDNRKVFIELKRDELEFMLKDTMSSGKSAILAITIEVVNR